MAAPIVYVVPVPGCGEEVLALKDQLRAIGCKIVCDADPLSDFSRCIETADFVLLALCEEAIKGVLDKLLVQVRAIGGKIIGVWPAGASGSTGIPAALHTFGYSIVRADKDDLSHVIIDGDRAWLGPDGKPRKTPPTPRHKG